MNIWLDCDTGHDDAYALLLVTQAKVNLLGVSTVHGNAPLHHTTRNTCALLEAFGSSSTTVVRGSSQPLKRKPAFAPDIHGKSGLDGVDLLPDPTAYDLDSLPSGIDQIYLRLISQPKDSVWLVATGPLTNIALLIAEYPDVLSVLKGVSIMGGAIGDGFTDAPSHRAQGPGNMTQFAEFNIHVDPEAAKIVLEHPDLWRKITLTTLDLTHQCRGDKAVQDQLFGKQNPLSTTRMMMRQVLNFFAATYARMSVGMSDGPPLHDPVAVFAATHPHEFGDAAERWRIEVVIEGEQTGRTRLTSSPREGEGMIIPRSLNLPVFWEAIDDALSEAEAKSPL